MTPASNREPKRPFTIPRLGDLRQRLTDPELWLRLAAHAITLGLVLAALWIARMDLSAMAAPPEAVLGLDSAPAAVEALPPAAESLPKLEPALAEPPRDDSAVTRLANLTTTIPSRPRYNIETYVVQKGDSIFGIAAKFNLKPDTILWGNPELADNPNVLVPGKQLYILPIEGALRVVLPGDTLEKIAKVFHGNVEEIVAFPGNDLDPSEPQIKTGQLLIIPNGWRESVVWQLPAASRTVSGRASAEPGACVGPFSGPTGTYTFVWPANNRYLSGWDYIASGHPGIDIAAGLGAAIYASDTGVIVFAGVSLYGYGNLVIIDHGNGWQTAYAHLSQINVVCGQGVFQGNLIGLSGSTGKSTGPHLHFEMRHSEYGRVNPWLYLP